ncbi:hypothetical protein ONQ60_26085, partial [Salmonella enterica subsp. enterica serovar Virginia]|nr:hypothetical protein [Salmonella enterica subsp. enterica serovar Virginia]
LGGVLVEYASWHWIFLINIPVGIVGAMATFMLMPNYTIETRRYLVYAIIMAITFAAGVFIILQGVRLILAEIVPAFTGFSEKLV